MTRVAIVIDSLVPGGTERSTVALLPLLIERGIKPSVISLYDRPGLQDEVEAAGVSLTVLSAAGGRRGWFRQLRSRLQADRPDLVHTSLFEADLCGRAAAARLRLPVVSSLVTERYGSAHLDAPHLRRTKVRAAQLADIATARLTRRLHAVSPHIADTMAHHLRYPRSRIDVVARGRPRSMSLTPSTETAGGRQESDLRDELGLSPTAPVVLALARHEQAKGLDLLLDAWADVAKSMPDTHLLVAGREGAHTDLLRSRRRDLGIEDSTHLLGHRDDVDALLGLADGFVLASRREGSPGALLEAMAVGTPVVVNDLPQVRDVVGPDEACIVDATKPAMLAAAIGDVLTDRSATRLRAERARERFLQDFTIEASADGMADFYQRAIASPTARTEGAESKAVER